MTAAARAAADAAQAGIVSGKVQPFAGPITDQSGTVRVAAGSVMADAEVLKMDWLVQGV
jgi:simple sugar transport system substrate-binding protein